MTPITASTRPTYAKDDTGRHITAADFVAGDYAARIAAGEIVVQDSFYAITAITLADGKYKIVRADGKCGECDPGTHLTVAPPPKPFVRQFVPAFSAVTVGDAPGAHHPVNRDAPHPGNAAAVTQLIAIMEHQRRRMQNPLRIPMGQPPILVLIQKEVA